MPGVDVAVVLVGVILASFTVCLLFARAVDAFEKSRRRQANLGEKIRVLGESLFAIESDSAVIEEREERD